MIKLFNKDCLTANIKANTIITDLPYGTTANKADVVIPLDKMWKMIKRTGATTFVTTAQTRFMISLINSIPKDWVWYDLVWDKKLTTGFGNARRQPLRQHENIIVMYKKGNLKYNPQMWKGKPLHGRGTAYLTKEAKNGNYNKFKPTPDVRKGSTDKFPRSIITIPKVHPSKALHRTEKPLELMEYLVKTYSNPGDTVFDPTMGVGPTGVVSVKNGRHFIGYELNKLYFDIATNRIPGGNINPHINRNKPTY